MHQLGAIPLDARGDSIAILFATSQCRRRWVLAKEDLPQAGKPQTVERRRRDTQESQVGNAGSGGSGTAGQRSLFCPHGEELCQSDRVNDMKVISYGRSCTV